jgi:uncharacterized protein (TIGR00369 family)
VTQSHAWDALATDGNHIWKTLGYRFVDGPEDRITIEWDAPSEYTFPNGGWTIVHGGMIATLLDTAMGHVCLANVGPDETFLTSNLQVEFYRAAQPGTLRAEAEVLHKSRRTVFCVASLYDADGGLLASARCTQIVKSIH